jgi:3-hydroxyacyl-CoA dehydrogenase
MNTTASLEKGSTVGVIGSGAMGSGIAQVAAAAGHVVRLFDTRPGAAKSAIADIGKIYARLVEKGRMTEHDAHAAHARLEPVANLHEVNDAALIVEAIVESLDVKRMLFTELESIVSDDCIMATNTSSISVTAIGAPLRLFQAAGFAVTRLDDVPGMAVMRTVAMLANEAADAVNQGVCSAQAVDIAMQKGVNYPRGPLAWADSVGVQHIVTVLANMAATYGEDRYRVSPLLRRKLAAASTGAHLHA